MFITRSCRSTIARSGAIYPMCSHTSPSKRGRRVARCSPPAIGCALSRIARKPDNNAPREVIDKAWQRYVVQKDGRVDIRAFTFCVLSHLQTAIHRRDVFTRPSWRYADPRANLLSDAEWEAAQFVVA